MSTGNAVARTGRTDGFLKNEAIKILLPDKLATIGRGMRLMGMGAPVDELEVGMNRAAEQATPKAKAIFLSALKKMSFDDARKILTGGDTAATDYFKRASSGELTTAFSPIVHQSMENVGVVKKYDNLMQSAPEISALGGNFNLDKYVVGKTLDGLFYVLGQEEQKIRKNPAAQTTNLLKEVFGRREIRLVKRSIEGRGRRSGSSEESCCICVKSEVGLLRCPSCMDREEAINKADLVSDQNTEANAEQPRRQSQAMGELLPSFSRHRESGGNAHRDQHHARDGTHSKDQQVRDRPMKVSDRGQDQQSHGG